MENIPMEEDVKYREYLVSTEGPPSMQEGHISKSDVQRENLCSYLLHDLGTKCQTDLSLVAKCGRVLRAHKALLVGISPLLKTLLSDLQMDKEVIVLPDIDYETIYGFLRLVYSGQAQFNSAEEIAKLEVLLQLFGFPDATIQQLQKFTALVNIPVAPQRAERESGRSHKSRHQDKPAEVDAPGGSLSHQSSKDGRHRHRGRTPPERRAGRYGVSSSKKRPSANGRQERGSMKRASCNGREERGSKKRRERSHSAASRTSAHHSDLQEETPRQKPVEMLPCTLCNEEFDHRRTLRIHLRLAHNITRCHVCPSCTQSFTTARGLTVHQENHAGEATQFGCPTCGERFLSEEAVMQHNLSHVTELPHPCLVCGKRFTHCDAMQDHLQTHIDSFTHICDTCDKKFADEVEFAEHKQTHSTNPYCCPVCRETFFTPHRIKWHKEVHPVEELGKQ